MQSDYFSLYIDYCANSDEAIKILNELNSNQTWNNFLNECYKNPETKRLKLDSYLIKPIQRVTKYPLLLRELLSSTPNTFPDYKQLEKANEKIKVLVANINEKKRKLETNRKVLEIQNTIDNLPFTLVQPHRSYINEAEFFKISKGKKLKRKFWLFNDIFLFAVPKMLGNPPFEYKGMVNLDKVTIQEGENFNIEILDSQTKEMIITFACNSSVEKQKWLALLKESSERQIFAKPSTEKSAEEIKLGSASEMTKLKQEIKAFKTGVPVKQRTIKGKLIHSCFSGKGAINWMIEHLKISDRFVAVRILNNLLEQEFFIQAGTGVGKREFVPLVDSDESFYVFAK